MTACNKLLVITAKRYKRLVFLLEVKFDGEDVVLDDVLFDESVDKIGIPVPTQLLKRQSNNSAHFFEIYGVGVKGN